MAIDIPLRPFWMMRHGQTVANVEGWASGSVDTPLTELGRQQAANAAPVTSRLSPKPSVIVHSPLSRAKETAQVVNAALGLEMITHQALREIDFGDWAGKPFIHIYPQILEGAMPPNGESLNVFVARVMTGLAEILAKYERPLIVAHGGVFDAFALTCHLTIQDVENCALYAFEPDSQAPDVRWTMTKIP